MLYAHKLCKLLLCDMVFLTIGFYFRSPIANVTQRYD